MQQIERYGVIALVFFLITIVAVSFWGDSKSPGFWSRLTGRGKKDATADHILPPGASTDVAQTPPAPLDGDKASIVAIDGSKTGSTLVPEPQNPVANPLGDPIAQTPGSGAPLVPLANSPATPVAHEYVVQKGDSLALISRRTLGKESRWTEIAALNPGLTPKNLKVGAKLALPADSLAQNDAAPQTPPATANKKPIVQPSMQPKEKEKAVRSEDPAAKKVASAGGYKVQKGDTLKAIARRELGEEGRWKEIVALNPGLSPSKLSVGQSLRLPAGAHEAEVAALVPSGSSDKPRIR